MAALQANVTVSFVSRVELAVRLLMEKNAQDLRNNLHIHDMKWSDVFVYLVREMKELNDALANCRKDEWQCSEVEEQLADLYGELVHAILKAGYGMEQIEDRCLQKFTVRFKDVQIVHNGRSGSRNHLAFSPGSTSTEVQDPTFTEGEGHGQQS